MSVSGHGKGAGTPSPRTRGAGTSAGDSGSTTPEDNKHYLIPGQDAKGHSERVWCRVMPGHHRALGMILASREFPFRSMGDVVRWCVDHGIRTLDHRRTGGPSVMRQVDIQMDILRDELYQQDFSETFGGMQQVVNRHQAANAMGEARRVVAMAKQNFEAMPEGYWRDRYLGELETQFGHLLQGEGVKLR